jgi:hypothetical protein
MNKNIIEGVTSGAIATLAAVGAYYVSPFMAKLAQSIHPISSGILVFIFLILVTAVAHLALFGYPAMLFVQGHKQRAKLVLSWSVATFVICSVLIVMEGTK